ncbi:hypothetical protein CLOP_g3410 [Closterium sp. NIES-67]|nr:hypothetical protein CLOP_g3410 [Closterium sp. NIES-67]
MASLLAPTALTHTLASSPLATWHSAAASVASRAQPMRRLPFVRASASPDPSAAPAELEAAPSTVPVPPPGWAEEQQRAAEAAAEERDGVTIRRRPPGGAAAHMVGPFQFRVGGKVEENVPRNILEEIVWHKDGEVAAFKERTPLAALARALEGAEPARDFVGALRAHEAASGMPALIAEVKKASPSRGVIQPDFDPVRIAKAYETGGAACLSVLTDSKFFQGSFENLALIREAGVACPLLCKEFIVDAWQVYCARSKGADAVLLIAAVLTDQDLRYLMKITHALGMAALIEVHTEREMDRVLALEGVALIGINNRDLGTFKVDIGNTQQLLAGDRGAAIRNRGIMVVGESGPLHSRRCGLRAKGGLQCCAGGRVSGAHQRPHGRHCCPLRPPHHHPPARRGASINPGRSTWGGGGGEGGVGARAGMRGRECE